MAEISKITLPNGSVYDLKDTTARSTGKVSGVKGNNQSSYRTGNVNITAENIGAFEKKSYDRGTLEAGIRPLVDQTRANRLVFLPADQIIIEKTTNGGTTWEDAEISDSAKINLFVNGQNIPIPLLNNAKSTQCGIRITITGMKYNVPAGTAETNKYNYWNSTYINRQQRYFNVREWWFWISSNNDSIKPEIYCATGAQPNNWVTVFNKDFGMNGWSGSDWIRAGEGKTFGGGTNQVTNYWNWRLIFWSKFADNKTEFLSNTVQNISKIKCYGDSVWGMPYKLGQIDHIYSYDSSQNTTFPANVTATQFNGNATSASKLNSTRSFTIGKTAKNVDWSGAVSFSQAEISDNASTTAAGWMSKDDKVKLNGIETGAQVNTITGVKGGSESSYRTGDVNITATNIGLGNLTNNKQVKGLSSGTTSGHLVTWGSDGYTVADSGIAKGSVATKLALSGTNYSASSNTITVTKANLQSAVQDSSLVLMTAAERTKLASIETDGNYVTIGTEQTITERKTFSALTSFTNSIKIGSTSQSTGRNSFSQGDYTVASGRISFSQGEYTVASGNLSHAEGDHSTASGYTAHAQGDRTEASNASAHAEGTYSIASGNSSHAQGMHTWAIGNYSHAQGNLTTALGKNSHAGGSFTIATRQDQTVIGRGNHYTGSLQETAPICSDDLFCNNDVIVGGSTADSGDYAFIIGNGQIPFRSNALTVNWSGVTNCFRYESKSSEINLNNTPTESTFISALKLMDVYGTGYADIGHVYLPDTRRGILMQSSLDGNHDVNALYLLMDSNGNSSVNMTQPQAWRNALGFEKKILINGTVWNGTQLIVISCGNLVTLIHYGAESGNWNGGAVNAYLTIPVGYRPYVTVQQIKVDQNNKRMIIQAKGNGQVGVYYLLDSITSKTNVYGTMSWIAYQ